MNTEYVTQDNGVYRIAGTRVSLDSVVYAWIDGFSPEAIVDSYPVLKLEEVFGALAYYLAHQEEVDDYIRKGEAEFEALRQRSIRDLQEKRPLLYQKLVEHKQRKQVISR